MTLHGPRSLTNTPTWAVAMICLIIVLLSLMVERGIHSLGKFLRRNKQRPLYEALQKMKEELMILGFISLLLTVARNPISNICIPEPWTLHMLPCALNNEKSSYADDSVSSAPSPAVLLHDGFHNRRLLSTNIDGTFRHLNTRRSLSKDTFTVHLCKDGYATVFSSDSLHELHMFIFVMAVIHVFYSCLTMLLGFTQLRGWRKWEEETHVDNYDFSHGLKTSFRLERQNTFVTSRTSEVWGTSLLGGWISSFFRQFGNAVTQSDYLSLRMGFIKTHNASKKFNFHEYMMRSLEDDFKMVVGISGYLWIFVIIFMILNVQGWYAYFWISFIPVIINMIIGAKLQHIITQLALETLRSHIDIQVPIKPRDELFWFNRPQLLLYLIHFVLFQNAFELAFCLWLLFTFGVKSCLVDRHGFLIIRIIVGFCAQVLCSYCTLPLYALVTQMGSEYKKAIFDERVKNAIYGWQSKAKERSKMRRKKGEQSTGFSVGQSTQTKFERLSEVYIFSSHSSESLDVAQTSSTTGVDTKCELVSPDVKTFKGQISDETRQDPEATLEQWASISLQPCLEGSTNNNNLPQASTLPNSLALQRSRSTSEFASRGARVPTNEWSRSTNELGPRAPRVPTDEQSREHVDGTN